MTIIKLQKHTIFASFLFFFAAMPQAAAPKEGEETIRYEKLHSWLMDAGLKKENYNLLVGGGFFQVEELVRNIRKKSEEEKKEFKHELKNTYKIPMGFVGKLMYAIEKEIQKQKMEENVEHAVMNLLKEEEERKEEASESSDYDSDSSLTSNKKDDNLSFIISFQGEQGKFQRLGGFRGEDTILKVKRRLHDELGWGRIDDEFDDEDDMYFSWPQNKNSVAYNVVLRYNGKVLEDKKRLKDFGIVRVRRSRYLITGSFRVSGGIYAPSQFIIK